jgi:hypothetical protein
MVHNFVIAAVSATVIALSHTAFAQQTGGTAGEAKAALMKVVAAVKADRAKALDMFNRGEGGFRDRDLYRSPESASACPQRHSHFLQLVHPTVSQIVTLHRHQETRSEAARPSPGRR